ncbi:Protein unc-93 like protein B1 [Chelonia mydas]|uniref:Protein unc-93 like protein B1 n=1 Tax=Chelonia mydas TaxID=8469 RepID=M7B694_CHEMY|nr:Protein unc-93 like protein B1 [Chelonia mydas]
MCACCRGEEAQPSPGGHMNPAMEKDPNHYQEAVGNGVAADRLVAGAGDVPGLDVGLDDFVGANPDYNEEEEERKYFRRKRLAVIKNVLAASLGGMLTYGVYLGLLQMQLILHYDETYREVKYSNMGLQDIDSKMLMGINVTPIVALLYTPILIRFFGTKWTMFLAVGIYALFVSTNYWERYYTLVPSAVAIGVAIVPLWASMGNYVTRMAQKYYEYVNYKEEHVQEQQRAPRGAYNAYIIAFQSLFYGCFHKYYEYVNYKEEHVQEQQRAPRGAYNAYIIAFQSLFYGCFHVRAGPGGTLSKGMLPGFNATVLQSLPRSINLIIVESVLMGVAFLSMLMVLILCGSAYRPTEEIDLRSIGWGNIFQLPFKHMRDYRLRHLFPFFIYSGFEVLFVCTGFSLAPLLAGAAAHAILLIGLFCWAPHPRVLDQAPLLYLVAALWGLGSALNKPSLSTLLGMLYQDKERQDFVFTIYHWWQALAIFVVYLWSGLPMKAKLSIMLLTLVASVLSYLWMEHKLGRHVLYRVPKIPKPRHKVRGYRYLEAENSDETGSEGESEQDSDSSQQEQAGPGGQRHQQKCAYEQALGEEDGENVG